MADKKTNTDRLSNEVTRSKCSPFDGVQMFTASKPRDRDQLGETISAWMSRNRHLEIVDWVITQSSDNAFHCVTMSLFWRK